MARNATDPALRSCDVGQGVVRVADPQGLAPTANALPYGSAPRLAGVHPAGGVSPVIGAENCSAAVKATRITSTAPLRRQVRLSRGGERSTWQPAAARNRP